MFWNCPEFLDCDFIIDATNSNSSIIGPGLSNIKVCVQSNFSVTGNFTFHNCIIEFAPNVGITVIDGIGNLEIIDSDLFACNDLWNGITVLHDGILKCENSKIEDAKNAVFSHEHNSVISLKKNVFNKNRIGINLKGLFSSVGTREYNGPKVVDFYENSFMCDEPLNGTTNEITQAGIKLDQIVLVSLQGNPLHKNTFENISYGIEANLSHIRAKYFDFTNILTSGIKLERGNLELDKCMFSECDDYSIETEYPRILSIQNSDFIYNDVIYGGPPNFGSIAIFVENPAYSSSVWLHNNNFTLKGSQENSSLGVTGIEIIDDLLHPFNQIKINENSFNIDALQGNCIQLKGDFSLAGNVVFEHNYFVDCRAAYSLINVDADISNLKIWRNIFDNNDPFEFPALPRPNHGISLEGNNFPNFSGKSINVSKNEFAPLTSLPESLLANNAGKGIFITNFKNATVCDNSIYSTNTAIGIHGVCGGTELLVNTLTDSGLNNSGVMPPQFHGGNIWLRNISFVVATNAARCVIDCDLQQIIVHIPPSPTFPSTFNPENRTPTNGWFIIDDSQEPVSSCAAGRPVPANFNFEEAIASGSLSISDAMDWELKRHLLGQISNDFNLYANNNALTSFHSNSISTTIAEFNFIQKTLVEQLNQNYENNDFSSNNDNIKINIDNLANELYSASNNNSTLSSEFKAIFHSIQESIFSLSDDYIGLSNNYENDNSQIYLDLLAINNGIMPNNVFEENEKSVNNIKLSKLFETRDFISQAELTLLISIAIQCPELGGMSVYDARRMLPRCIWEEEKENVAECAIDEDSVQERLAMVDRMSPENRISLYPNPTNNKVIFRFKDFNPVVMKLTDPNGRQISEISFQQDIKIYELELKNLNITSGIVFCSILNNSGELIVKKIILND